MDFMNSNELTCQELVELVTGYLDNVLPAADRLRFEEHLAGCRGCTNYVEQARHTIRLAGRLTESALSPTARDELLRAFGDWKEGKTPL
jgi:anti-sigma factor RsiW